jgi:Cas7 group CRISPR-associated protein Csh2
VQFGLARSVNKVRVINPSIVGRFVGREGEGNEKRQHSTMGKFYAVEYALIKAFGAITPRNLGKYRDNAEVKEAFNNAESNLFECLWDGTNALITRSKYPQRSILYIEVSYKSCLYNDLPWLVEESADMKGWATSLSKSPFRFEKMIETLSTRKEKVKKVKVAYCDDISEDAHQLINSLKAKGLEVDDVQC